MSMCVAVEHLLPCIVYRHLDEFLLYFLVLKDQREKIVVKFGRIVVAVRSRINLLGMRCSFALFRRPNPIYQVGRAKLPLVLFHDVPDKRSDR